MILNRVREIKEKRVLNFANIFIEELVVLQEFFDMNFDYDNQLVFFEDVKFDPY